MAGDIDLGRLMADAAILFHFGGYSDAMRAGVIRQIIRISPAGDVLMDHSFSEKTITPFGQVYQAARLSNAATSYQKNFVSDADDAEPSEESKALQGELPTAWVEEFGFDFERLPALLSVFQDFAMEGQAIQIIPRSALLAALREKPLVSENDASRFLDAFTLVHRPDWSVSPKGFQPHAWQPWRFRRQLSVVSRPILAMDLSDDPT
ncbi:MAG: hypothetical protein E5V79_03965, partial [Mesorhizobium sp.]